jgi:hypothetical protein
VRELGRGHGAAAEGAAADVTSRQGSGDAGGLTSPLLDP